ncbi:MAG TPA: hypothetical protein VEQ18_03080, partial [Candidatus Nitrosocosmicus sp.]|nr:hypothetical protein [Candidatus Nitrosocosmicus sp.]
MRRNTNWSNNRSNDGPVQCYRCREFGHISTYCTNPCPSDAFALICGNCKQNGHRAEECNAPRKNGPRDGEGYNQKNDTSPKIILIQEDEQNQNSRSTYHVHAMVEEYENKEKERKDVGHVNVVATRSQKGKQIPFGNLEVLREKEITNKEAQYNKSMENLVDKTVTMGESSNNVNNQIGQENVLIGDTHVEDKDELQGLNARSVHFNPELVSGIIPSKDNSDLNVIQEPNLVFYPNQSQIQEQIERVNLPHIETGNENQIIGNNVRTNWEQLQQMDERNQIGTTIKPIGKKKKNKPKQLGIIEGLEQYDLIQNLNNLKADITIAQLLAIAPWCRSILKSKIVRRRAKPIEVNEVSISPDPGAPMIDIEIDGLIITGVQIDGGSSVNLMNKETMENLNLSGLLPTKLVLRMADQSRVKPLGILSKVKTKISGLVF